MRVSGNTLRGNSRIGDSRGGCPPLLEELGLRGETYTKPGNWTPSVHRAKAGWERGGHRERGRSARRSRMASPARPRKQSVKDEPLAGKEGAASPQRHRRVTGRVQEAVPDGGRCAVPRESGGWGRGDRAAWACRPGGVRCCHWCPRRRTGGQGALEPHDFSARPLAGWHGDSGREEAGPGWVGSVGTAGREGQTPELGEPCVVGLEVWLFLGGTREPLEAMTVRRADVWGAAL